MPLSALLSSPTLSLFPHQSNPHLPHNLTHNLTQLPKPKRLSSSSPLFSAARRSPNYPPGGDGFVDDPRNWNRNMNSGIERPYGFDDEDVDDEDEDDEEEEEEEEDRSLDLLVRFVQNVFKKVSKRARRAVRSVLPVAIPTKLVGFSVNGVLLLAFLWVLKAFLEVICTLGSLVFISILLIRGIWIGVAYVQENRNHKMGNFEGEGRPWTGAQPAT